MHATKENFKPEFLFPYFLTEERLYPVMEQDVFSSILEKEKACCDRATD